MTLQHNITTQHNVTMQPKHRYITFHNNIIEKTNITK